MALIVRHTDVLGGYEHGKGGGIVGGWVPYNQFRGWRQYSVVTTYEDPAAIELPILLIRQTLGPPTDTVGQIVTRNAGYLADRSWPHSGLLRGSYPDLAWYFMDPATLAYVAGPLLPIGDADLIKRSDVANDQTQYRNHFVQWFEMTPPTGPYLAVLVAREPSTDFPLWVSGHPVEILADRITASGDVYDSASATAVTASLGTKLQHSMPVTSPDDTVQALIDQLSEGYGFTVRRSLVDGKLQFVHWLEKLNGLPTPTITSNDIRADGGPTFALSDQSRINRVRVNALVPVPWTPGIVMVPKQVKRKLFGFIPIRPRIRWEPRPALSGPDKPAAGLSIQSVEIPYNYSTDGVTNDADIYGEQEADVDLGGCPGLLDTVNGGAAPLNLVQWTEGRARLLFDSHARGRQQATVLGIRGTDCDDALLGEAVTLDIDHGVNAQLGQSPTSQRGGPRPFRVIDRTPDASGHPDLVLVDEGTGVPLDITPTLRFTIDGLPGGLQRLRVRVSPADEMATARAQIEFQIHAFADGEAIDVSGPGLRYTVFDTSAWTDEPQVLLIGDFPAGLNMYTRARVWLVGGAAGPWSLWTGVGGPITGPQTTLSDLVIDQWTDEGARLTWSYDEAPPVGEVQLQYRDITGGVLGAWFDYSSSPLAAGTETETLVGLLSGKQYEVNLQLIDGSAVPYGDVLTGTFATTGGKISSLSVTSVTASTAKLNWTNTDAIRNVLIELQSEDDADFWTYQILAPTSNRRSLTGLIPAKDYDVRVSLYIPLAPPSLIAGVSVGDGAFGPALTDSFTTLAVSQQLGVPLTGGAFEAFDPQLGLRYDGRFGMRLHANPNNLIDHEIVVLLAVETAAGSATAGTFVEQAPMPASPGVSLWFVADAPNDGKLRYMKALSRAAGMTDSIETIVVQADPWPDSPQPPAGGGIPNAWSITATALAASGTVTGSFLIPDGAELYQVSSNTKDVRVRLYRDSATVTSDISRVPSNSSWPAALLFDAEIVAADSHSISLPPPQRIRFLLADHESRLVYYRLDSLESGTEDFTVTLSYFAATHSPLP